MLSLTIDKIPKWLHNSEFYETLISDSELTDKFEIPAEMFSKDHDILDVKDFLKIYKMVDFWNFHSIPQFIIDYFNENKQIVYAYVSNKYFHKNNQMYKHLTKQLNESLGEFTITNLDHKFRKTYFLNYSIMGHNIEIQQFIVDYHNPNKISLGTDFNTRYLYGEIKQLFTFNKPKTINIKISMTDSGDDYEEFLKIEYSGKKFIFHRFANEYYNSVILEIKLTEFNKQLILNQFNELIDDIQEFIYRDLTDDSSSSSSED